MDLTSLGTDYASELATNAMKNAEDSAIAKKDLSKASDEELMDACKQFEEYFVEQIFKTAMKSTTLLSDDDSASTYISAMKDRNLDLYTKEMASSASKTGQVGLAKELYEQMKKSQGVTIEEALQKKAEKEAGESSDPQEEDPSLTLRMTGEEAAGMTGEEAAGTTGVEAAGTTGEEAAGMTGVEAAGTTGVEAAGAAVNDKYTENGTS